MATYNSHGAVRGSPLPTPSPSRRPITLDDPQYPFRDDSQSSSYFDDQDPEAKRDQENLPRTGKRPLPDIQLPPSGRIHGAPMSPVRVNVQGASQIHRPSSARIESYEGPSMDYDPYRVAEDEKDIHPALRQTSPLRQSSMAYDQVRQPDNVAVLGGQDGSRSRDNLSAGMNHLDINSRESTPAPVERLNYHHQASYSDASGPRSSTYGNDHSSNSSNRLRTPNTLDPRNSGIQRPMSTFSYGSGYDPDRGRSPYTNENGHLRNKSSGRMTPDTRPTSYMDLLTSSYAQQQAQLSLPMDNSDLRNVVGTNASLLSTQKTLDMYRMNVKKTSDNMVQYSFALLLVKIAKEKVDEQESPLPKSPLKKPKTQDRDSPYSEAPTPSTKAELISEAKSILQRLSERSFPFAQYYLGDGYFSGFFNKDKPDPDRAFPLFIAASKHGHAESGYRAALCYEYGWGTRKDVLKAVQFYKQSASKNHPGAMTRLGKACINRELGLDRNREGVKWLKRATEAADSQYNTAPYLLALLYTTGDGQDVFKDEVYAAQLLTQAAELGNMDANHALGEAYEHGTLSCPRDPALSVHFYTTAAQQNHPLAMMALCAWYMIGAPPVLLRDEYEAFEWAQKAANLGLMKAQYATGYFRESGIGCRRDLLDANLWYVRAADAGDKRAKHRLAAISKATSGADPGVVASGVYDESSHEEDRRARKAENKVKKRREAENGDYGLGRDKPLASASKAAQGKGTGIAMAGRKENTNHSPEMRDDSAGNNANEVTSGQTRFPLDDGEAATPGAGGDEALIDGAGNANVSGKGEKVGKEEKECIVM